MKARLNQELFKLTGKVAVVTGGAGELCSALCRVLADAGVKVAVLDINGTAADQLAGEIVHAGGQATGIQCDVCDKQSLGLAAQKTLTHFGKVDFLINGAGGNNPQATTSAEQPFFDLPHTAIERVVDLNLISAVYACQVFGKIMAEHKKGVILNIASMNAIRPLTRIPAYSAAKAALWNFTQWLAVYMAQDYSPDIRVNAIAPGFFITSQNRYLLTTPETGELTERGQKVIDHTPMRRFGTPGDLAGTLLWLLSPASAFVTGIIVPIDGGFSAFSGV